MLSIFTYLQVPNVVAGLSPLSAFLFITVQALVHGRSSVVRGSQILEMFAQAAGDTVVWVYD